MSSEEDVSKGNSGKYYVFSHKPPEEAAIFGLRGSDIKDIWAHYEEEPPVSPEDWGFTGPNEDGICQYCQLMLHPEAPSVVAHQPNLQALIASTCNVCDWVEVSIVKGSPETVQRFQQGDPDICSSESTLRVTVGLQREPKFTRAVAHVGPRGRMAIKGIPLNLTTSTRLGDLMSRRFWEPYGTGPGQDGARLNILKTWLDECREHHETCSSSLRGQGGMKLPTRILDLTGSLDNPSKPEDVQLRLRETSSDEVGDYVALSYCWGEDPQNHFKTTRQNLQQRIDGIDFGDIPLTQREAILATLRLGVRYLWIDSLCILQDSTEDWEREAATMGDVYSNALVTLGATSAQDPGVGLLNPLQAARCVNIHGDLAIVRLETHMTIDASSEPLNKRAWTLQEAFLSPRTISFGREQWLWECASRYATEDGLIDRPLLERESLNHWYSLMQHKPGDDESKYLKHWYQLVSNYSGRRLTYQSDKLKAIAGLADIFAKQTGYHYVAGLWQEDIAAGLMWQATSRGVRREPAPTRAPTWSWASTDGPILTDTLKDSSLRLVQLLKVEQKWHAEPGISRLEIARLHVRGTVLNASLGKRSMTQSLRYHLVRSTESDEILGEAFLDNLDPIKEGIAKVCCLNVHQTPSSVGEMENYMLLLVPTSGEEHKAGTGSYRRIGIAVVWEMSRFPDDRQGLDSLHGAEDATLILK